MEHLNDLGVKTDEPGVQSTDSLCSVDCSDETVGDVVKLHTMSDESLLNRDESLRSVTPGQTYNDDLSVPKKSALDACVEVAQTIVETGGSVAPVESKVPPVSADLTKETLEHLKLAPVVDEPIDSLITGKEMHGEKSKQDAAVVSDAHKQSAGDEGQLMEGSNATEYRKRKRVGSIDRTPALHKKRRGSSANTGVMIARSVDTDVSREKRVVLPRRAGIDWKPGAKLQAMDFQKNWYAARIVSVHEHNASVLIHFDGWNSKFDQWIDMKSDKLKPFKENGKAGLAKSTSSAISRKDLKVGSIVLAKWSSSRYPALVKELLPKKRLNVEFYDGVEIEVDVLSVQTLDQELQKEALHVWDIMKEIHIASKDSHLPAGDKSSRRASLEVNKVMKSKMDEACCLLFKLIEQSSLKSPVAQESSTTASDGELSKVASSQSYEPDVLPSPASRPSSRGSISSSAASVSCSGFIKKAAAHPKSVKGMSVGCFLLVEDQCSLHLAVMRMVLGKKKIEVEFSDGSRSVVDISPVLCLYPSQQKEAGGIWDVLKNLQTLEQTGKKLSRKMLNTRDTALSNLSTLIQQASGTNLDDALIAPQPSSLVNPSRQGAKVTVVPPSYVKKVKSETKAVPVKGKVDSKINSGSVTGKAGKLKITVSKALKSNSGKSKSQDPEPLKSSIAKSKASKPLKSSIAKSKPSKPLKSSIAKSKPSKPLKSSIANSKPSKASTRKSKSSKSTGSKTKQLKSDGGKRKSYKTLNAKGKLLASRGRAKNPSSIKNKKKLSNSTIEKKPSQLKMFISKSEKMPTTKSAIETERHVTRSLLTEEFASGQSASTSKTAVNHGKKTLGGSATLKALQLKRLKRNKVLLNKLKTARNKSRSSANFSGKLRVKMYNGCRNDPSRKKAGSVGTAIQSAENKECIDINKMAKSEAKLATEIHESSQRSPQPIESHIDDGKEKSSVDEVNEYGQLSVHSVDEISQNTMASTPHTDRQPSASRESCKLVKKLNSNSKRSVSTPTKGLGRKVRVMLTPTSKETIDAHIGSSECSQATSQTECLPQSDEETLPPDESMDSDIFSLSTDDGMDSGEGVALQQSAAHLSPNNLEDTAVHVPQDSGENRQCTAEVSVQLNDVLVSTDKSLQGNQCMSEVSVNLHPVALEHPQFSSPHPSLEDPEQSVSELECKRRLGSLRAAKGRTMEPFADEDTSTKSVLNIGKKDFFRASSRTSSRMAAKELAKKAEEDAKMMPLGYTVVLEPVNAKPSKAFIVEKQFDQFKCKYCQKCFRKDSLLASHIKYNHKTAVNSTANTPSRKSRLKNSAMPQCTGEGNISTSVAHICIPPVASQEVQSNDLMADDISQYDEQRIEQAIASCQPKTLSVCSTESEVIVAPTLLVGNPTVNIALSLNGTKIAPVGTHSKESDHDDYTDDESIADSNYQTEVVNCKCGFNEEDSLMIQCEYCCCWQHSECFSIKPNQLPGRYLCYVCLDTPGVRKSSRYLYDYNWRKHGLLPQFDSDEVPDEDRKRAGMMRKSQQQRLKLLNMQNAMQSIRRLMESVAKDETYELVLWSPDDCSTTADPNDTLNMEKQSLLQRVHGVQNALMAELDAIKAVVSALETEAAIKPPSADTTSSHRFLNTLIDDLKKVDVLTQLQESKTAYPTNPDI